MYLRAFPHHCCVQCNRRAPESWALLLWLRFHCLFLVDEGQTQHDFNELTHPDQQGWGTVRAPVDDTLKVQMAKQCYKSLKTWTPDCAVSSDVKEAWPIQSGWTHVSSMASVTFRQRGMQQQDGRQRAEAS